MKCEKGCWSTAPPPFLTPLLCCALQLDFVPALTLSPTLSTPLLCIALQSVFSTTSMSSQMHNRYVIKSARARTLSAYSRYAPPSYTYPHGNRVTKKDIKRHRDDLDLFVERDAECRDELGFAGSQELVVDYGQFEGCEFVAGRALPYLKLGFAKNMCLVFSLNMPHAAQSLQNQVGTRGSSNIRGLAGPGFWQAWKSMPYKTYVPLQEGEYLTMTAEDLHTGGVFLLGRPNGMLLVVPPSKHQSEADLRHEFALAMRSLPVSEDTWGGALHGKAGLAPQTPNKTSRGTMTSLRSFGHSCSRAANG